VMPPRYFVADTDHDTDSCTDSKTHPDRIVSFESLSGGAVYSQTTVIDGQELERPHDLEYNAADRYFYGVTAPMGDCCDQPKILFRFRDIEEGGNVVDGDILEMSDSTDCEAFYMRSLSVVDGTVYVVNSTADRPTDPHGLPQVFRIIDFATEAMETYTAHESWYANLQDVEFHEGWWYGTGSRDGPLLARWQDWDDFQNGNWEDLSDLVPWGEVPDPVAYFLTRWNKRLFFPVYRWTSHYSWIYEIVDCEYPAETGFDLRFVNGTDLTWTGSEPGYALYRGTLSPGEWQFDQVCLQPDLPSPSTTDLEEPGSGSGFYYLVSGVNECGEGALGTESSGKPRPNRHPCQQ